MTDSLDQVLRAKRQVREAAAQHAATIEAFLDDSREDDLQRLVEARNAAAAGNMSQHEYAEAVEAYLADPRQEAVDVARRRLQEAHQGYAAAVESFLQS